MDNQQLYKQIENALKFAHKNLDGFAIKKKVDHMGIDNYINRCAFFAGSTGAAVGSLGLFGGPIFIVGVPTDIANMIAQQLRVTLAVIYHRTGNFSVEFSEFMRICALSLGLKVGFRGVALITQQVSIAIARQLLAKGLGRMIPVVGGVINGGGNYVFVKSVGSSLLALEDDIFNN